MRNVVTAREFWTARQRTVILDASFWIATMPSFNLREEVRVAAEDRIWSLLGVYLDSLHILGRDPPVYVKTRIEDHLKNLAGAMMNALAEKALHANEQIQLEILSQETAEYQMAQVQRAINVLPTKRQPFNAEQIQANRFLNSVVQSFIISPAAKKAASDAVEHVRKDLSITPIPSPWFSGITEWNNFTPQISPNMSPLTLPQPLQGP